MGGADFEDLDHYLQQSFTNSEGDGQWSYWCLFGDCFCEPPRTASKAKLVTLLHCYNENL